MNELLKSLVNAVARLGEVLEEPESSVVRDAAIQRFEFCFELGWKTAQKVLRGQGIDVASPRSTLKACFAQGWVDEAAWLAMLEDRNLTSHTYDQELAAKVYARLRGHHGALEKLAAVLAGK
jgi:nucleotidyltransferase substrate binding protein (TIGR01987 family)